MDIPTLDRHIIDWDETDVHTWLSKLGYPHYDAQIREHKIRGDVLISIDSENLKLLGVSSIGQRLAILKAIYFAKVAYGIPRDDDSYVPPSESSERANKPSFERLQSSMEDQARRLRGLEDENRQLNNIVQAIIDDFNTLRTSFGKADDASSPLARQPSFKWAQFVKPQKSPTKPDAADSPRLSPQNLENDSPSQTRNNSHPPPQPPEKLRNQTNDPPNPSQPSQPPRDKPHRQESTDNLKSFKVSLDDPTWKVLPAALKKYRITNDTWQNYAMFICFGPPGNRVERCLSYDEKPLLLFQKLKDAQKNPVFMLKHIKDIRSPIAVAQQKHAARKASSVAPTPSTGTHTKQPSTSRSAPRPPKLEVQDLSAPTPIQSSLTSPQAGWPETGLASPAVEKNADRSPSASSALQPPGSAVSGTTIIGSDTSNGTAIAPTTAIDSSASRMDTTEQPQHQQASTIPTPKDMSGVSYAVAIYPYMAEQEDEFDVVVGDTFVILSRQRGWWIVQRDLTGSGVVDADTKQGWVPAGCLLETNVPVASAIAEATAAKGSSTDGTNKTPILPLSIISTSYPGIALMDYKKKGEEELDLAKDDALRVFKRYNHWSYAVKENGGDRGWVPSWFIGKVQTPSNPSPSAQPPTPANGATPNPQTSLDEAVSQAQVSPMSSAFPLVQSRP